MNHQQRFGGDEGFVRRYETEHGWTVAADLGVGAESVDVDVVDLTAIVVIETGAGVREEEIELPAAAENVEVNNGVLVVEGTYP